ncbi:MRPL10 54S ribosomal protein L10 [Candida maltosa Xu316]|uniref:Large subunit ribosomal protein, mitochondrial, putative n=1 Tax=Candida maltosa (strain Xu316) TaxID=1245528 RepID=M3JEX7_CANMX|nr:Large subunit ribosomal protein, mitochondrial, putative [Candida maltosa Xu316]
MFSLPSFISKITTKQVNVINQVRGLSRLGFLSPHEGSVKGYKRLGRGQASGKGKTAGRGQKGQKARGKVPWWFEGGQTPYYKRFPMIGFKKSNARVYEEINLNKIQDFWNNGRIPLKEGDTLDIKVMRECGLSTGSLKNGIKILSKGPTKYTVPLNIEASRASEQAIKAIEGLGREFTARYFSKLGLRAHVNPESFLLRFGYVPLQARPTNQKDIKFYSNPEKRGYLEKDPSILTEPLNKARESKQTVKVVKKASKYKSLEEQLQEANDFKYNVSNSRVKVSELLA